MLEKKDLLSLVCVNQSVRIEAEPYLYSEIIYPDYRQGRKRRESFIIPLLRTILDRPDLAHHLHTLRLSSFRDIWYNPPDIIKLPVDELDLVKANLAIDSAGPAVQHFAPQWKSELEKGVLDAIVTLLISQLRNLRELEMQTDFTKSAPLLGHFLRVISLDKKGTHHNLSTLKKLKRVNHILWPPEYKRQLSRDSVADVMPFFSFEQVKHLAVALKNPESLAWSMANTVEASHITILELSMVREVFLGEILSHTTNLKSFSWDWHYDDLVVRRGQSPLLDLDILDSALQHVRLTLEHLEITGNVFNSLAHGNSPIRFEGSLKGIAHHTRLHTVESGMPILAGSWHPNTAAISIEHLLPRQIKCLHINRMLFPHQRNMGEDPLTLWHPKRISTALQSWSLSWRTTHPFLEHIDIEPISWRDDDWVEVDHLDIMQDMRITVDDGMTYVWWKRSALGLVTRWRHSSGMTFHEAEYGTCKDLTIDYPEIPGKVVSPRPRDQEAMPLSPAGEGG